MFKFFNTKNLQLAKDYSKLDLRNALYISILMLPDVLDSLNLITKATPRLFSLNPYRIVTEGLTGILIGLISFPITCYLTDLETKLFSHREANTNNEKNNVSDHHSILDSVLYAPFFEEFVFHGILPTWCKDVLVGQGLPNEVALGIAITASNLLFGIIHSPGAKTHAFLNGLTRSGLTLWNGGNLWAGLVSHITNNSISEYLLKQYEKDPVPINSPHDTLSYLLHKLKNEPTNLANSAGLKFNKS